MMGVAIGLGLAVLGIFLGNFYVAFAGFIAAAAFALLNREPETVYIREPVPAESGPRHRVLQPEPPAVDSGPMPWEIGLPYPQGLSQLVQHGKGSMPDAFAGLRGPAGKWGEPGYGGLTTADLLPFGNYGHKNPAEWLLGGFPINIGKIAMARYKKEYNP